VVFQWVYHHDGGGVEKSRSPWVKACSERRLWRPSSPHIGSSYGNLSNGVSVNTHMEFALEILMTMAPILDEGVPSLSFRLEGVEHVVPYEY
jgi:hypothetical protein